MSKAGDIAKVSAKGSFHVLWGLVLSTVILSVGTIFIARLLGSDLYGLYTVVLTVPAILQVFRDWGMNSAIIKFTAQYRAEQRMDEIRSIFFIGILFKVITGLAFAIFSLVFADYIAASIFNRPEIAPLIQIVSFSILAGGLVNTATAIFTGIERLELNGIMLVIQSILKTLIMISLVIAGFGTAGATLGYTVGNLIAAIFGVAFVIVLYKRLPKLSLSKLHLKAYFTTMFSYSLPLSLATIITTLLPQFYAFLLPIYYVTDNVPIGNYGVAVNFVVLIAFFITPISTMIFPAFSKLDYEKDQKTLRDVFQYSIKYGSLIVIPATFLVMCLAEPAVTTLFGHTYTTAGLFLALLSTQYLFTAFGSISLPAFLNGQDKTSFTLRMGLLTGLIGFPLGYLLIMSFGALGLIAATVVASLPSLVWGLFYVKGAFGLMIDWSSSIRILLSSAIAGSLTYGLVSILMFAPWIRLLLGLALFVLILIPALLLSKAITRLDIANLKLMTAGLGVLGRLIGKVFRILERLMKVLKV